MSSTAEVVVLSGDDLLAAKVLRARAPRLKDYCLAVASLAAYAAAIAIFNYAPEPVIETQTVLEMREVYAAFIDMPPPPIAEPRMISESTPLPSPAPRLRDWSKPYDIMKHLRTVDGLGRTQVFVCDLDPGHHNFELRRVLASRMSTVRAAPASKVHVVGGLSSEVVRRTIARNLNQIRFCYEQALQIKPNLQGRVVMQLVIAPTGAVQFAAIARTDRYQPQLEACITQAVTTWRFRAPEGGGIVSVTYPFVLEQVGQ